MNARTPDAPPECAGGQTRQRQLSRACRGPTHRHRRHRLHRLPHCNAPFQQSRTPRLRRRPPFGCPRGGRHGDNGGQHATAARIALAAPFASRSAAAAAASAADPPLPFPEGRLLCHRIRACSNSSKLGPFLPLRGSSRTRPLEGSEVMIGGRTASKSATTGKAGLAAEVAAAKAGGRGHAAGVDGGGRRASDGRRSGRISHLRHRRPPEGAAAPNSRLFPPRSRPLLAAAGTAGRIALW